MPPPVLRIALPLRLNRLFDYLAPEAVDPNQLIPGVRVKVPFQSREMVGILTDVADKSTLPFAKLKTAHAILDQEAILTADIKQLCEWAASYYQCPLGEVLSAALPALLRKGKILPEVKSLAYQSECEAPFTLNADQHQALTEIIQNKNHYQPFLLDGVTGSGKTEIYLQAIAEFLKEGKQTLVLVPEISLTPQTIARFRNRFNAPIVALHSHLTDTERLRGWLAAKTGEAKIVIGTRSAIFTPFKNLQLLIVDEEHDQSFKQQDRFRYHARDLAVMRAKINQIPVVLGSATPSLETLVNVERQRYHYLSLPTRAGDAAFPQYELIDLRQEKREEGLSEKLLQRMREELVNNNHVLLFLNRRGFAPVLFCQQCGYLIHCKRCDVKMVYHQKPLKLKCHHCDALQAVPKKCSQCGSDGLQPIGLGTQRIEKMLQDYFRDIPILRIDRDSTRRKNSLSELLAQIATLPRAILLGTQMLAKGHHFKHLTLVGVIDADCGLFGADFRAAEQMGQLLIQVAGRAGRAEKKGTVLIQTRNPQHPLLKLLIEKGYGALAEMLLTERRATSLPPYHYFALCRADAFMPHLAQEFLQAVKGACHKFASTVTILGPVPALIAKRKGRYTYQLLFTAKNRLALQTMLKKGWELIENLPQSKQVKWIIDVDPMTVI